MGGAVACSGRAALRQALPPGAGKVRTLALLFVFEWVTAEVSFGSGPAHPGYADATPIYAHLDQREWVCPWVIAESHLLEDTLLLLHARLPKTFRRSRPTRWDYAADYNAMIQLTSERALLNRWITVARCSLHLGDTRKYPAIYAEVPFDPPPTDGGLSYLGPRRTACLHRLGLLHHADDAMFRDCIESSDDDDIDEEVSCTYCMGWEVEMLEQLEGAAIRLCMHSLKPDSACNAECAMLLHEWCADAVTSLPVHIILFVSGFVIGLLAIFGSFAAMVRRVPLCLDLSGAEVASVLKISYLQELRSTLCMAWRVLVEGRIISDCNELWREEVSQYLNDEANGLRRTVQVPSHTAVLNLSDNLLPHVPEAVLNMVRLTSLDLSHNLLQNIPPEIGKLVNLEKLNIANNALTFLPEEIGKLEHLRELYAQCNMLYKLPDALRQLTGLETLNLRSNYLSGHTFTELRQLPPQLVRLSLRENKIKEWPWPSSQDVPTMPDSAGEHGTATVCSVARGLQSHQKAADFSFSGSMAIDAAAVASVVGRVKVTALVLHCENQRELQAAMSHIETSHLSLSGPQVGDYGYTADHDASGTISTLPPALFELTHLRVLQVPSQRLTEIPKAIGMLHNLEEFDIRNNMLTALPSILGSLVQLKVLFTDGNPFQTIPLALARLQGSIEKVTFPKAAVPDFEGLGTLVASAVLLSDLRQKLDSLPWSLRHHKNHAYSPYARDMFLAVIASVRRASVRRQLFAEDDAAREGLPRLPPELWIVVFSQLNGRSLLRISAPH